MSRLHILIHCWTIAYLNTWLEDPFRLSAAIAYLNTCGSSTPPPSPPPPSDQLRLLLLAWLSKVLLAWPYEQINDFFKNSKFFHLNSRLSAKSFRKWAKNFRSGVKIVLYLSRRTLWRIFFKKNLFIAAVGAKLFINWPEKSAW